MKHRCFKIKNGYLDLFLTALYMNFSVSDFKSEAKWVFQCDDHYDVVVQFTTHREDFEKAIEEFVEKMHNHKKKI